MEFLNIDVISALVGAAVGITGALMIFLPKNSTLRDVNEALEAFNTKLRERLNREADLNDGLTQELAASAGIVK